MPKGSYDEYGLSTRLSSGRQVFREIPSQWSWLYPSHAARASGQQIDQGHV